MKNDFVSLHFHLTSATQYQQPQRGIRLFRDKVVLIQVVIWILQEQANQMIIGWNHDLLTHGSWQ